ncbi:MAG: SpoVA/SpoVAEb family sporulation membrane protein [Clostridiales bacterium]|nr:SpoVA/SpoVAEb family sporulation membrane protein [Clostridiales bacterium]
MSSRQVEAKDVVQETDKQQKSDLYNQYVKSVTPKHNSTVNLINAFWVGGLICVLGQWLMNLFLSMNLDKKTAGYYEILVLVLLSVILTALNIYPKIAKFGGAGTLVPITGFANSVASAAIEFQTEGQVFGIGCKIFNICGPVILYGIVVSWVLGLLYWILKMSGALG